jgi:hypothetical protein
MLSSHPLSRTPAPSALSLSSIYYPLSSLPPRDPLFIHQDPIPLPRDLFGTQTGHKKDLTGPPFLITSCPTLSTTPAPPSFYKKPPPNPSRATFFLAQPAPQPTTNNRPQTSPKHRHRRKTKQQIEPKSPSITPKSPLLALTEPNFLTNQTHRPLLQSQISNRKSPSPPPACDFTSPSSPAQSIPSDGRIISPHDSARR